MAGRLVIPSVTSDPVRTLLSGVWDSDVGTLAIQTVKTQVEHHETRRTRNLRNDTEPRVPSLFDAAAEKIASSIGEDAEQDMESLDCLPPNVFNRVAWRLQNIPYDMFCKARQLTGDDEGDVDEWVLLNEVWLREASSTFEQQRVASSKRFRGGGPSENVLRGSPWKRGLVRLSVNADVVFHSSTLTDTCRTINRPMSLTGFKILDGRRSPAIRIQPSAEMFGKTFEGITGGLLKGLDWANLFVAGGIVLGSLLCTGDKESTNTADQWKKSDVDMYIYGLGPVEANKKIEHVFSVFKANLPPDMPALVVRNSKTITFFSNYPLRRIQMVLKLVESPKDVLLNFDLDVCAVGWDGEEVWMLPRAARALETGYTVFTMDLINGHYLGDRRATQEQRVFKYADKGFGLRILPSYLEERRIIMDDPEKCKMLNLNDDKHWDPRSLYELVDDARKWTSVAIKGIAEYGGPAVPRISHKALQERTQKSEDPPGRSVLSGLSLFMRHVALWEQEVAGIVIIDKDMWAAPFYDNIYPDRFGVSYNDAPDYSWDENFTMEGFIQSMAAFNHRENQDLEAAVAELFDMLSPYTRRVSSQTHPLSKYFGEHVITQRISHATSVEEVLKPECDIYLFLSLPTTFVDFANDLIPERVQKTAAMPGYTTRAFMPTLSDDPLVYERDSECLQLVVWRITSITMWQQLDRTIDEVHEVLWSFHIANTGLAALKKDDRLRLLVSQFGKRAIRMTTQDEYGAFARWVAKKPATFVNTYSRYFQSLLQDPDYDEDEEA